MPPKLNTLIDNIMQYVPAEERAKAQATYSQVQDEISRVVQVADQQKAWWEANSPKVAAHDALLAENTDLKSKIGQQQQPAGMDKDQIAAAIAKANQETVETGLGLVTVTATLVGQHMAEFGKPLDAVKLAQEAIAARMPLDQYYNQTVAAERQARQQAAVEKQIADAREAGKQEGIQAAMAAGGKQMPFPMPNQPAGILQQANASRVDGKIANPDYTVEAAVRTAVEVANRQSQ